MVSTLLILLLLSAFDFARPADDEVKVSVGEQAVLKCPVLERCGDLHSIRWYKGEERIAILSETANLVKAEGSQEKRIEVSLDTIDQLKLSPVELDDEGRYRCDLTYMNPIENCKPVHIINLKTLLKPESLKIFNQDEAEVTSLFGGLLEGNDTSVECRVVGGRPIPKLTWTLNGKGIPGDVSTSGEDASALTISRLVFTNERKLQGAKLKCSASTEALSDPMEGETSLDLILRPTDLSISGVEHHVVQGSKVTLECLSQGARPPAAIVWMNDTKVLPSDQTLITSELQSDGTYNTISRLSFWATRWDHNHSFNCESRQLAAPVYNGENHLNASKILNVHYPPMVFVFPESLTVNETMDILLFCEYDANPKKLFGVTWMQNDTELDFESAPGHYEGGEPDQPSLLIKNSSAEDIGSYYCKLQNSVGTVISDNFIAVDVHYKPKVQLIMDVDGYVVESAEQNVTLECVVVDGNPNTLLEVKWYLDGELLKHLPDCNETSEDLCNNVMVDKFLLEKVDQAFHGNYSCQGLTYAGWGPRSNDTELLVYYEPGQSTIVHTPKKVVKGDMVNLTCSVEDPGRPSYEMFNWYRNGELIEDVNMSNYTINVVDLSTEANFSCSAVNFAGIGLPASVFIDVLVPPTLITGLSPTTGYLFNSSEVSLTCRAECSPTCKIVWRKNEDIVDNDLYSVIENVIQPDPKNNTFESLESSLIFNLDGWPNNILNRITDNANYTCTILENGIGPEIQSFTSFEVEFPPENMTVSNKVISINEDDIPEEITCNAFAKPEPKYRWYRYTTSEDKKTKEILSAEHTLNLTKGVKRTDSSDLICEAYNDHGTLQINTYLNVMFKPECKLTESEDDEGKILICTAVANPSEVDFEWSIQDDNDTIPNEAITQNGAQSIVKLYQVMTGDYLKTYVCVVNNSVGFSSPCSIPVQGVLAWWMWWSNTALIVAGVIVVVIILVILLCLIIFCVCRKRRAATKYNATMIDDQESNHIQNESSIIQAIVSESMSKSQSPLTPTQYSEKSRLVARNKLPVPNKPSPNKNPLAGYQNSGKLQADLSLLEASYQASLLAKPKCNSELNLSDVQTSPTVTTVNETENKITESNNNEIVEDSSNKAAETQGLTVNKWPLKPGVLVHVNSNHSLSPKKFGRSIIKPEPVETEKIEDKPDQVQQPVGIDPVIPNESEQPKLEPKTSALSNIFKRMDLLIGFGHKDKRGIKRIFQSDSPVIITTDEVVTFRKPVTNPESETINDSERLDTSNESKSNTSSRKRKKPGEAPANGGVNGNNGIDNPGVYENLPFHGLQQAPNKPIQIIQPRIVQALTIQNGCKTPEAMLERQLKCNPSFTPRILSCPPYSHQSINAMDLSGNLFSKQNTLGINSAIYSNTSTLKVDKHADDDQKFYSLNMRRDRLKKTEPRFNSMKIVRKRKLDRFYPSKHRIDYVIVNKNHKLQNFGDKSEIVYANTSNVNDSFQGSYQNLTDSIQIHENSLNKTPTPAPRLNKSLPDVTVKRISKNHVYANVSAHIHSMNAAKSCYDMTNFARTLIPHLGSLGDNPIPKTLPRRCFNPSVSTNSLKSEPNFDSSTFPKRTSKSGILMKDDEDKPSTDENKDKSLTKGKIISSRTPSRNHSFDESVMRKETELDEDSDKPNNGKTFHIIKKTSPNIVDATPKVKPFTVNSVIYKSPGTNDDIHREIAHRRALFLSDDKAIGKVVPKQQMPIKPPETPLQIPNLIFKPIPKVHPTQLKRSQSSLSGKGISNELLQQYKGESNLRDGSLVKAKIKELNLKQAYRPNIADQFIYADADLKDYGPINYKQASIYAQMKKVKEQQKMEMTRKDDEE